MGVRLLPKSFATHSVFISHAGVTCCGSFPTAKWSTIRYVAASITSTVLLPLLGTYTRRRTLRMNGLRLLALSAAYTSAASTSGGTPPAFTANISVEDSATAFPLFGINELAPVPGFTEEIIGVGAEPGGAAALCLHPATAASARGKTKNKRAKRAAKAYKRVIVVAPMLEICHGWRRTEVLRCMACGVGT